MHYSHISVRAKEADLALQVAQTHLESNPGDVTVRDSLGDLRKKATFLAEAERHFYFQKAKIHFLKQGDRNTKFFHDMVKRNAARNSIMAITKADGSIITSAPEIAQEFVNFYTSLLGTADQTLPVDDGVFHWGHHSLRSLPQIFVGQSHRQRSKPRSFRLVTIRHQEWADVTTAQHTIIALVPKSEHSPSVADYRPISCCNVIYKVITKIIADRLSPALMQLIDRSQAAFVGGRNITDNIFLAQEMVRQYSRKRISPRCTINVDLRKAFDSVSWTFLSRVLHGYGFPPLFISWIMECVSTTSFSVALNGPTWTFPGEERP
ncbi:UNVERIFIED_CONTAM: Retrovirus-related Pol polyprotein from type-2 retrotransposable element R2DM [Sesamum radiatum]|uniref:Retrovirus-related Pol polyprotein from type-2 retrotransposable element R2DM n=1 Tax=Sesamum radiatum TaxID=300843 RepID=A0AAW2MDQ4_SESRA